jgi:prevent-host-death family protein
MTLIMPKTISQRELRNGSAAVMDAVEAGETMIITRNGNPVAELRPIRQRRFVATADLKLAFQNQRKTSYEAMRAEADQILGEDRIGD